MTNHGFIDVPRNPVFLNEGVGLCALSPADPEWWSADAGHVAHVQAKRICRACPLQAACLRWAVRSAQTGVWGGRRLKAGEVLSRA